MAVSIDFKFNYFLTACSFILAVFGVCFGQPVNYVFTGGNGLNGQPLPHPHHVHTTLEALTGSRLINLTINWTIENFVFLLEEPEIRSPAVSSAEIGLVDADGEWQLVLTPTKVIAAKTYVGLHLERVNATAEDVTGRFGFHVLDRKGASVINIYDESTNVFTIDPPQNNWGYDKFIPHTSIFSGNGVAAPIKRQPLLVDGNLIIRAKIEFLGPLIINSTLVQT